MVAAVLSCGCWVVVRWLLAREGAAPCHPLSATVAAPGHFACSPILGACLPSAPREPCVPSVSSLQILPHLVQLSPNLHNDVMVFNAGWVADGRADGWACGKGGAIDWGHMLAWAAVATQSWSVPPRLPACPPCWLTGKLERTVSKHMLADMPGQPCTGHASPMPCRRRRCCRLHYPELDQPDGTADRYVAELSALADWRQEQAARLPQMVWIDTGPQVGAGWLIPTLGQPACSCFYGCVLAYVRPPLFLGLRRWPGRTPHCSSPALLIICPLPASCLALQHFLTHEGTFPPGGKRPMECRPLEAWYKGDPVVAAGTRRNVAAAPLIPRLADAHLRIYNASVPLWDSHLPGECSHWCDPAGYHLWLFLLNDVLRDSKLGNQVRPPDRHANNNP